MTFIIGRAINGISINGKEYLLGEDGNPIEFPSVEMAKVFLVSQGFTEEEIENALLIEEA
jgi:hypothetical protein